MELMGMDERQRLAWFMANRGTVIFVGAVWIGMIGWELTHGRAPLFLMLMVPVIALFRAGLYHYYSARPLAGARSDRDPKFVRYVKLAAAVILAAAALAPIYTIVAQNGRDYESRYLWDLVRGDMGAVIPLAFVYLWPFLTLGLARLRSRRVLQLLIQFAEPALAVVSCIVILWIPQLIFEGRTLFFLVILVNPVAAWGCYVAVAANGLYLVAWLAGMLDTWGIQEG
jgi:hypothetical protein